MAESRNKLRAEKSKAPMIYMGIVLGLFFLFFMIYGTYNYMQYAAKNDLTELDMEQFIASLNDLFSPDGFYLPFSWDLLLDILKFQITKLWWVYLCAAAAVFIIATSNNKDDYKGMEHGSSRWANKYEKKKFTDSTGIPCGDNFYITVMNVKGTFYSSHNLNEIVIGGSGAGKSFRKIKVDIMQMTGSYVVTDPSGELYRDCAKPLRENGYKVRVFNLNDITLSNTYNPFNYMVTDTDAINVADLFIKNTAGEGEKDDFWSASAKEMLFMIMLYIFKSPDETKSFSRIVKLLTSLQFKNGVINKNCEIAKCIKRHQLREGTTDDAVSIYWNSIKSTPAETLGSITKTLSTRLSLWAIKEVDMLTSTDEMDFDDIGVHKTAIFLIIPAARQTYKALANIFYTQLFERLMYIASLKYNNRLPLLVSCELDEFANIGRIPNFSETLAVVRKYNIRLCIVLQGLSQLKAIYEKTWESIIGNCSIFTFLGTNDQDSKEYVSKKLGKTTVRVDSKSYNRGGNHGGGSDSESYIARDLLAPDEIPKALIKGKNGKCIVFVDEFPPFFLDKFDTLRHPLIGKFGSDRGTAQKNNSDITVDFARIKTDREKYYEEQQQKAHQISTAIMSGNYDEPLTFEENQKERNKAKLQEMFESSSNEMISFNDIIVDPNTINLDEIEEDKS